MSQTTALAGEWSKAAIKLLEDLAKQEGANIAQAAQWCADSILADGVVHLFGSGHSRIPLEEMFPRYGSYPGFNPMAELSQRQAMFIERVEGFAEEILKNWQFNKNDILIIFSVGGKTAVPIEMAQGAKKRGIKVIAVTSIASNKTGKPSHSSGTTLSDNADLVIDLMVPVGDALISIPGMKTPVGPGSTITEVAVANEIKVQVAQKLVAAGFIPPVITSSAVVGEAESKSLFDAAYAEHARRLSSRLAGSATPRADGG